MYFRSPCLSNKDVSFRIISFISAILLIINILCLMILNHIVIFFCALILTGSCLTHREGIISLTVLLADRDLSHRLGSAQQLSSGGMATEERVGAVVVQGAEVTV